VTTTSAAPPEMLALNPRPATIGRSKYVVENHLLLMFEKMSPYTRR
jgi:hypothetical protein